MRIVIFGSNNSWSIERFYAKYLSALGCEVYLFDSNHHYKTDSLIDKVKYRYFPKFIYKNLNKSLLNDIEWSNIDILWVFKGIEIFYSTLEIIKNKNVFLANYNPDHPYIRTFHSSGSLDLVKALPLFNLHFSYSKSVLDRIKKTTKCDVSFLPFGYESSLVPPKNLTESEEINMACFVGNPDSLRIKLITRIVSRGFRVAVYGNGWELYFRNNKMVECCGVAKTSDLYNILRSYRVQLNIFRPHNIGSHNMRTFEIASVGGIQLAPFSEDHAIFFHENSEIFLYNNEEELFDKLNFLLNAPWDFINRVRENAQNRSLIEGYSYEKRAQLVYSYFKKMISGEEN